MNSEPELSIKKGKFQVVSVEPTTPPAGMPDGKWHRYVIGQGTSKIEGMKLGSLKSVTQHAETVADDLNERANRSGSTYAPRNKRK